nr:MAG TPA: hypothetical protein [Caudoviricetes sp.]
MENVPETYRKRPETYRKRPNTTENSHAYDVNSK